MALIFLGLGVHWAEAKENSFIYDDRGKRDPFWSLVNPGGNLINYETDLQMTDLSLEGIMVGTSGKNLAVINNKVVKVNDVIGQFKVIQIDKDFVILSKGQPTFELKLKKED